jgi:hypothetical protein
MENEKNNLAKALKLLEVEISRSLRKVKVHENELATCKQSQEPSTTQKLDELLKAQKVSIDRTGLGYMTHGNSINNTFVSSSSKGIIFVKGKEPFMPKDKSNNVQKGKLKGKFIPTYQHCGIEGHVKRNYFISKNQNLEYKVDLVLNQLCAI